MDKDRIAKQVEEKWDAQGECRSCGWHACLSEYGDIGLKVEDNGRGKYVWLPCLSGEPGHRGVYVYLD